jgi:hypothetical protein
MSVLSREDLIELGVSTPTSHLMEWATSQLLATKGRESRLAMRGVTTSNLSDIRDLTVLVGDRQRELGDAYALPPEQAAMAERIRAEADGYWRQAKQVAVVAFATQPDLLAKFRTGVRTGLLISNLVAELSLMNPLLREHSAQFALLGVGDAFATRGELLVARLEQAKSRLDEACKELPPKVVQLCYDKGLLYDLTRKLVRVGRLEFMLEPEQASHFNFILVRRDPGKISQPRLKKTTAERE